MLKPWLRYLGFLAMLGLLFVLERPAKSAACEDACAAAQVIADYWCDYQFGSGGVMPDDFCDTLCKVGDAIAGAECAAHCPRPASE